MAKISLICDQCGGTVLLNDSHEIGTCEYCFSQFIIKQDKIIQHTTKHITQNVTKYIFGGKGKEISELLLDGYKLINIGDYKIANKKFKQVIDDDPDCWEGWLGYAETGGDRLGYLSIVRAYKSTYSVASGEKQELDTFVNMIYCLPDNNLRSAFVRAFNLASGKQRHKIFNLVVGVIGCDESEIASLAIDLCPDDWRAHFAMAKFRQIRAKWCKLEGGLFVKKHLPLPAEEVVNTFMQAYRLAKKENDKACQTVLNYINDMESDTSYRVLANVLLKQVEAEK